MTDNQISGYAALWESEAVIAGEFRERLAPGAFTRTLREHPDVLMLLAHDSGRVLGRTSARTLSLREDSTGLWFSLDVDETTPEGQTALGNVRRRDVRGCSFGFRVRAEEWQDGGRRLPLRTITDADLFEVTLTGFPAYGATSAALRTSDAGTTGRIRERMEREQRLRGIL